MSKKTTKPAVRKVFYAWQSDSPEKINRFFIRDAIKKAVKRITSTAEGEPPIECDEAARGIPGSPMIIDAVLGKIEACDVFVGDISTINPKEKDTRRVPNPNVMFEAGWAAARLGWNRVLLVFNESTGAIETDVPFDLRGHFILTYRLEVGTTEKNTARDNLTNTMVAKIKEALDSPSPIRPKARARSAMTVSPEQQRERDRHTLYQLLGKLDTQWVDAFLDALLDERILNDSDVRRIIFTGIVDEARFNLFDIRTEKTIREFVASWNRVDDMLQYGHYVPSAAYARFRPEFSMSSGSATKIRGELRKAQHDMYECFRSMLARIRQTYPEFDFVESDKRARKFIETLDGG